MGFACHSHNQWSRSFYRIAAAGMVVASASWAAAGNTSVDPLSVRQSWNRSDIHHATGLAAAKERLGQAMPTGKGVVIAQVEGPPGAYAPDPEHSAHRGVRIMLASGPSRPADHANRVGSLIYGSRSLAPGVEKVYAYAASTWVTAGHLGAGTLDAPAQAAAKVFNHSWIGRDVPGAAQVLRRLDYDIDVHGTIHCVGVDNGRRTTIPDLLASSHNAIVVGSRRPEGSSGGLTPTDPPGRSKPDLVGPFHETSYATAMVTAGAALLLDAAARLDDPATAARAQRPQTIKALLMTAALKPGVWSAQPASGLDDHLGAGVLNLDRSLQMLAAGPGRLPTHPVAPIGWLMAQLPPHQTQRVVLELEQDMASLTATLVWHRRIQGVRARVAEDQDSPPQWIPLALDAHLTLSLERLGPEGDAVQLAGIQSDVDNVAHLFFTGSLPAGRYVLSVTRRADRYPIAWPYALAWYADGAKAP